MATLEGGMAQFMYQDRPWAGSSLVGTKTEIEKNGVFRSLARELKQDIADASMADAAVAILCPGGDQAVEAYYRGNGHPLRKLLSASEIRVLDRWLALEVRICAERWGALDPSRHGPACSTNEAIDVLRAELRRRVVPGAIRRFGARLTTAPRPPSS